MFGPPEAAAMVQTAMDHFKDWGFNRVNPTLSRSTGGTDSTSFNNAGLPGIGYSQDPFDYNSYTHHTSFDTYERIYEPDVREAAVEEALTLYALAMSDQMLPRCSAATMPGPPPGRGGGAGGRASNVPVTPVAPFSAPPLGPGETAPATPALAGSLSRWLSYSSSSGFRTWCPAVSAASEAAVMLARNCK